MLEVVRSGLVGLVFTLPMMAAADTLTYAVTDESWVPYWMVDDGQVSGVFSDVMHALDERLAVDLQAARPAPPLRAQKMFRDGQVQLECCVSQQWRTAPEQVEVTLWTERVLEAHEVLVFAPGHAFAFTQLADLRGKTIATVRGYGYVGSEYFRRHDSPDAIALLYKVAHGRSQAGIIDRLELAYLRHGHPQLQSGAARVEEGPVINSSELRIRLHRSRAELLPALNAAIAQLRRDGSLQRIMSRYAPPSQ
ncbi:substrate-binding periplasmic protein [Aquipseudomonas alcaligenes]|nr:transporter substrate-binding domain-containing protein [Pseudomonas alcaligenes]SUD18707.1 amino acid ABC transporter periplasmic protein [Pseudomonas alcaligenes]